MKSWIEIISYYRGKRLVWKKLPTQKELLEIQQHNQVFDWDDQEQWPQEQPNKSFKRYPLLIEVLKKLLAVILGLLSGIFFTKLGKD